MEIILRDYQLNSINALRGAMKEKLNKLILCAPTGAGKTVMFSYICSNAISKGKKCLILSHRAELLNQSGGSLSNFGVKAISIKGSEKIHTFKHDCYVAMAQTIVRRINKPEYIDFLLSFDIVIIDECHEQVFNKILRLFRDDCYVLGFTATPERKSNQVSLDAFYQKLIEGVKVNYLIENGYLARPITYGIDTDLKGIKIKGGDYDEQQVGKRFDDIKLFEGVYENYMKITPGKKAIIFSSSIESSLRIVNEFENRELPIKHIDANTKANERTNILQWFKNTPNALLSNCGILTTGFDEPTIEVVILYRATKSISLFKQMCGRGSRRCPAKDNFYILDFGNNIKTHNFWEHDTKWSLKKKKKREGIAPVKDCPNCHALLSISVNPCNFCGYEFELTKKEIKEKVIAELQLLSYNQIKERVSVADFQGLHDIAEAKGFKKGWIYHQLSDEEQIRKYAAWKGYKEGWISHQLNQRQNAE